MSEEEEESGLITRRNLVGGAIIGSATLSFGAIGALFFDGQKDRNELLERYSEEEIVSEISQLDSDLFEFNEYEVEVNSVGAAGNAALDLVIDYETTERDADDLERIFKENEEYVAQQAQAFEILMENVGAEEPLGEVEVWYKGPVDLLYETSAEKLRDRPANQSFQNFYEQTIDENLGTQS